LLRYLLLLLEALFISEILTGFVGYGTGESQGQEGEGRGVREEVQASCG